MKKHFFACSAFVNAQDLSVKAFHSSARLLLINVSFARVAEPQLQTPFYLNTINILQPVRQIVNSVCVVLILVMPLTAFSQSNYYDVTQSDGMGVRFWSSDHYKIHMGNSAEYHFGPVTDYSVKMNMSNNAGRGWTWGISGQVPVAALSNTGNMKLSGFLQAAALEGGGESAICLC